MLKLKDPGVIRMTVGEFIKVTYIETGTESPEKLRYEGFGDILDDKCVIDEKAAQRLSERLGRSPGSWIQMYKSSIDTR